jgi:hypothetical protein
MLVYLSIGFLVLAPLVMLVIRLARPAFGYHWLIAVAGALVAWPLILIAGLSLPQTLLVFSWTPGDLVTNWPILLVDRFSWPFAVALITLVFACILTEVARAPEADWSSWSASLVLTALGVLAVFSGNPLALLLTWMAIDFFELLVLLLNVNESKLRERVVVSFTGRVFGSGLLVAALLVARAGGETLSFAGISPRASLLLLLAGGLRLGVLPFHLPFLREPPLRRGLGTLIRLVPASAALVLLARTALAISTSQATPPFYAYLLGLSGLGALYAASSWFFAPDELSGRPAWLLALASFSVASALKGEPSASLAWGIAALFSGGLLFLSSARDRRLAWLTLLGILGFSALPFTPAWNGARLFDPPFHPLILLFLASHALLILGYARHTLRQLTTLVGIERWVWAIYPFGLALLILTHFAYGLWTNPDLESAPQAGWWAGPAALGLAGLLVFWDRRGFRMERYPVSMLDSILSLNWLYSSFWFSYHLLRRLTRFITEILEGEAGILWALLVLVLLLVLLSGNGGI